MADSSVAITAGSGTPIRVLTGLGTASADQQVVTLADSAGNLLGTTAAPFPIDNPDATGGGSLAALNAAATIATNGGNGLVGIQVTGTFVATLAFEATTDGTNWFAVNGVASVTGSQVSTVTTAGQWRVNSGGYASFRVRASAYTSGTAVVSLIATSASTMATLAEPLPAGTNSIGTVQQAAITKGTQGATGVTTQDLKDAGRQTVVLSAAGVASVTTVGLITLNVYVAGTVTSATTYSVPAGKTFRIQSIQFGSRFTAPSTTVTFASTTFAVRYVTTGTAVVGSPILHQDSKMSASNVPTPNSDMAIPDGLELPAGYNIGVTHLASAATLSEDVAIVGFLY